MVLDIFLMLNIVPVMLMVNLFLVLTVQGIQKAMQDFIIETQTRRQTPQITIALTNIQRLLAA